MRSKIVLICHVMGKICISFYFKRITRVVDLVGTRKWFQIKNRELGRQAQNSEGEKVINLLKMRFYEENN